MAEWSDQDTIDFKAISKDYEARIERTHIEMGKMWFIYMDKQKAGPEKRRRMVLTAILSNIQGWGEMVNNAEVVLGSGEMVDQEPIHLLVDRLNWADPNSESFSVLIRELDTLMTRVGKQVDTAAKRARVEVNEMVEELIARNLLVPEHYEVPEILNDRISEWLKYDGIYDDHPSVYPEDKIGGIDEMTSQEVSNNDTNDGDEYEDKDSADELMMI